MFARKAKDILTFVAMHIIGLVSYFPHGFPYFSYSYDNQKLINKEDL